MGTVEHKVIVRDQATPILKNIGAGFLNLKNIAIGAGIAIATKFGKECVDSAAKLETAFAKVRTIGELTESQMNELVKASIKYGKSAVDAAAGLYDIYSAGHKGAEGMEILNVALKTSVAGFVDVKDAASSIIDVMNAYGEAAGDAARVSEVLLKGVELGKYVFEDYGGQLGRVTSLAKQLGMEFTELIALLDVLTVKGVDFSEAVTQILGILNAMIKPTDSLKQVFADWGYENAQAAIEVEGFIGVLERLYELSGKNMNIMGEWIPRVRGLQGFVTALSGETDKLAQFQYELANSTGTLDEKYKIMNDTFEQQVAIIKEKWHNTMRGVGRVIIEIANDFIYLNDQINKSTIELKEWLNNYLEYLNIRLPEKGMPEVIHKEEPKKKEYETYFGLSWLGLKRIEYFPPLSKALNCISMPFLISPNCCSLMYFCSFADSKMLFSRFDMSSVLGLTVSP